MIQDTNPWDVLATKFAPAQPDTLDPGVADNVLIAQPVVLDFLQSKVKNPRGLRLLEFGCGGGQFADRLHSLGYIVSGVDSSSAMIASARSQYGKDIDFTVGTAAAIKNKAFYDVVASVMTLQFIPDIEDTLRRLVDALKPNGLLVFAVHNPDFVSYLKQLGRFSFGSADQSAKAFLKFGDGTEVAIYIRTASQYKDMLSPFGLEALLEAYPPITAEYLKLYPIEAPSEHSEYLILGFQKNDAP